MLDVFGALGDDGRASRPMSNPISQRRSHALLAGMFGFIALQAGITCTPTQAARLSDLTVEVRGAPRSFGFDPAVRGYDVPVLDRVVTIQARGRDIDARIKWSLGEVTGVASIGEPLEFDVQLGPGKQVLLLTVRAQGRKPGSYSLELNFVDDARACVDHTDCQPGQACSYLHPVGCFVGGLGGCVDTDQDCEGNVSPVCGCDGITYPSLCQLQSFGVALANLGDCACSSYADCGENEYCDARSCHGPGQCVARPENCEPEGQPVLACDGDEYDSECDAAAAGQRVLLAGGQDPAPSPYLFMYLGTRTGGDIELFTSRPGMLGATRVNQPLEDARVFFAQWSPNGSDIAYSVLYDPNPFDIFYICGHCPRELFTARPDGTGHTKVSLPLGEGGQVQSFLYAPAGERIAYRFKADRNSLPELLLVRPDGSETASAHGPLGFGEYVNEFDWSPDGKRVAYAFGSTPESSTVIYTNSADGTDRRLVTRREPEVRAQVMVWSPDSKWLAYIESDPGKTISELFSGAADGSGYHKLNGPLVEGSEGIRGLYYKWSPDSSRIMYRAEQDDPHVRHLYTSRPDGSDNQRIGQPDRYAYSQDYQWSPDGSLIAYFGYEDGERGLFFADPDGSERQEYPWPPDEGVHLQGLQWSPDGSRVLLAARASPSSGTEGYPLLISSRPDGTDAHVVHPPTVSTVGGSWSPDGTRIAYIADQDTPGVVEIYTSAPDGSNNHKVSHELPDGADLRGYAWSPDGALIVYRVDDDIYSAQPDGSQNRQVSDPGVRPGGAWYWSSVPVPH